MNDYGRNETIISEYKPKSGARLLSSDDFDRQSERIRLHINERSHILLNGGAARTVGATQVNQSHMQETQLSDNVTNDR